MLGRAVVSICGSLAVMFWYSWQLSLITIAGVIPTGFATIHFSGKLRIIQRQVQQVKSEMTVVAEESYQNIRTVKAFANEDEESRKFKKGNENLLKAGILKAAWMGGQTSTNTISLYCSMALVIYIAKILIKQNKLRVGQVSTYLFYMLSLVW